jgi:hypothetical protein
LISGASSSGSSTPASTSAPTARLAPVSSTKRVTSSGVTLRAPPLPHERCERRFDGIDQEGLLRGEGAVRERREHRTFAPQLDAVPIGRPPLGGEEHVQALARDHERHLLVVVRARERHALLRVWPWPGAVAAQPRCERSEPARLEQREQREDGRAVRASERRRAREVGQGRAPPHEGTEVDAGRREAPPAWRGIARIERVEDLDEPLHRPLELATHAARGEDRAERGLDRVVVERARRHVFTARIAALRELGQLLRDLDGDSRLARDRIE